MLLSLTMPRVGGQMCRATITRLAIVEGTPLAPGTVLLDARVDLSAAAPQDCPPVYHFRVVSRERAWVRRVFAAAGEPHEVGGLLALLSTEPEEPAEGKAVRPLRVASAGILDPSGWLDGG